MAAIKNIPHHITWASAMSALSCCSKDAIPSDVTQVPGPAPEVI